jgi:hypothetical protein
VPQEEVVDYFDKAVDLFKGLPSYKVCHVWFSMIMITKLTVICSDPSRRWYCTIT